MTGTYDGSNLKIYLDGVLDNTCPAGGYLSRQNVPSIIGYDSCMKNYFPGKIDEVKIWNKTLTNAEILTEYNRR